MRPEVYNALVQCLQQKNADSFDKNLINPDALHNSVTFTIKNYKQAEGVSFRPFEDPNQKGFKFDLLGPIGKPLLPDLSGLNVAFAAGTGVLPFIDLVAAIARHNLGIDNTLT